MKTIRIRYVGEVEEKVIPRAGNTHVRRGDIKEFDEDVALGLMSSGDFIRADQPWGVQDDSATRIHSTKKGVN